jgi:uncharacterized protein YcbK (DUF882 family)
VEPGTSPSLVRYALYMRKFLKIIGLLLVLAMLSFFLYFNNTALVSDKTVAFYNQLKDSLRAKGYSSSLLVVSTKRVRLHNYIQVKLSGAAPKSRHLAGDAMDFLVFDVNNDGSSNAKDVDIVYQILNKKIIQNKGGLGTYKKELSFFNRQMVHIDCRGYGARWF